jgi:Asp-tRNA(Asn)/Glu-tRNA(Gln) amidotransferase C subunit
MIERGKLDLQTVVNLAHLAGFEFEPNRCQLLVKQLAWILAEAGRVEAVDRGGIESVQIFLPAFWRTDPERDGDA